MADDKQEHPILKTHPHLTEFIGYLDSLNAETERGAAIVTAAVLEDMLGEILRSFMLEGDCADKLLDGFNAPLGTFSSRGAAAAALGLISAKEYADAEFIRKIRNQFAHKLAASFGDQKLRDLSANLHFAVRDVDGKPTEARDRFSTGAAALIINLTNRAHYVRQQRCTFQEWTDAGC